jgi:outer membrane biosynthesis protein TonB
VLAIAVLAGGALLKVLYTPDPAPAPPPTATPAPVASRPAPMIDAPPPPPEPPPAAPAAPERKAVLAAKPAVTRPGPCEVTCNGRAGAELQSALRAKAGQARSCYERALAHNSALSGTALINVRIGPSGEPCSASLARDTLEDAAVTQCVVQRFRTGKYPKPAGGCVDAQVPISFVPAQP